MYSCIFDNITGKKTYKILTLKKFPINNNGKISYGKLIDLLKIKGLVNDTQRVI